MRPFFIGGRLLAPHAHYPPQRHQYDDGQGKSPLGGRQRFAQQHGGTGQAQEWLQQLHLANARHAAQRHAAVPEKEADKHQSKTGTGTYAYPAQGPAAVRPHAVSTVTPPGGAAGQFGYDNGNLISGSTFGTWTSFDMPIRLTKGSVWADFTYGPEHQRTSQHRSDGSWVYYAGAQEVDTAGGTTVKTYWPNGIGVEIDRGTSATELSWTHVDRLGSPIALTNETGGIREKLEYDVWGKRRDTLDNESTPDTLDGKTDNRGFTGHEMLEQLDLVHMNGRVFNPLVGRFLSADGLVNDPINGQSLNLTHTC
jgi:RHS repeat-associated protein